MTKALVWLLFTYGVLKLAAMARAGNPGFRRAKMRWRDRIRAGEPFVLLLAFLLAVPAALLTSWYAHRTLTGLYEHSTDCYGRVMALRGVSAFTRGVDSFAIYESVQDHKDAAFVMARDLNMKPEEVSRALADKAKLFAARYAALQRRGIGQEMLGQIRAARRCLLPPGTAPKA